MSLHFSLLSQCNSHMIQDFFARTYHREAEHREAEIDFLMTGIRIGGEEFFKN